MRNHRTGYFVAALSIASMAAPLAGSAPSANAAGVNALVNTTSAAAPSATMTARTYRAPGVKPAAGASVPAFTRTISSLGKTYSYSIVGKDPFVHQANPATVVQNPIIPVRLNFTDQNVFFDPTLTTPGCGPGTAISQILSSPLYSNTTLHGKSQQWMEDFQRTQWFQQTMKPGAINPGYSTRVNPVVKAKVSVNLTGFPVVSAPCGKVGLVEIGAWDNYLTNTLLPQLRAQGLTVQQFPMFVFLNVVMYQGNTSNCCILGYHNSISAPGGRQTYGVSMYDVSRKFSGVSDISVYTHELGEWMDDPFVNNGTPAWGHLGQVSGCQANLENGDPLSGTVHSINKGGFTFHPQELAFFSWFYRESPSTGINGWYSSNGKFKTDAGGVCGASSRTVSVSWSAAEAARLKTMGNALGPIGPAQVQKKSTYIVSYILGFASSTPTPVTMPPPGSAVTYTDVWTSDELPVLDRVKQKYALSDANAERFATKLIDYLLALGGH